jgi:hypothetical protein
VKFGRTDNESIIHFADVTIDRSTELCHAFCPGNHGYADYCADCEVRRIFTAAYIARTNAKEEILQIEREEGGEA